MASPSRDFYTLSRRSSDLDAIEAAFPPYLKLRSICWLLRLGVRTPEGVVLADRSEHAIAAAIDCAQSHNWARFLLRHDSPSDQPRPVQGGFLVEISELGPWTARFVHGGVCILLEPFDAIRNGYNLSWLIERSATLVELVGPGFDASDLQRGQIQPHEIRSVDLDSKRFGPPKLIAAHDYRHSVAHRERKIWWKYRLRELVTDRWRDLDDAEMLACQRYIRDVRGQPIPRTYRPIPAGTLQRCLRNMLPIVDAWREPSAVVASSFVETGELIFWDVSTHARWTASLPSHTC
jgi:hypothetical protein